MLSYGDFHALIAFVVNNMAFGGDACCSNSVEEGGVSSLHIGVSPVFQGVTSVELMSTSTIIIIYLYPGW